MGYGCGLRSPAAGRRPEAVSCFPCSYRDLALSGRRDAASSGSKFCPASIRGGPRGTTSAKHGVGSDVAGRVNSICFSVICSLSRYFAFHPFDRLVARTCEVVEIVIGDFHHRGIDAAASAQTGKKRKRGNGSKGMGQGNGIKGQRPYQKGRKGKGDAGHSLGAMNCGSTEVAGLATIMVKVAKGAGSSWSASGRRRSNSCH